MTQSSTTTLTPQNPHWSQQLAAVAGDIKLAHSVFALPFALLAAFLAAGWAGRLPGWDIFALVVICMVLARTVAMTVNRWADAEFDADNPRTIGRAIPTGRASASFMLSVAIVCGMLFIVAAAGFWVVRDNPWPVMLSPGVLAFLAGYSFMKRLTLWCHVYLGAALAISPVAAAIAVEPTYLGEPAVWLLAGMVLTWVTGFDVLYALQDLEVDQTMGLHSIPAAVGESGAVWASRGLHTASAAALLTLAWVTPQLDRWFLVAACVVVALLVLEHIIVATRGRRGVPMVFLTINGVISLLLGFVGILEIAWRLS